MRVEGSDLPQAMLKGGQVLARRVTGHDREGVHRLNQRHIGVFGKLAADVPR